MSPPQGERDVGPILLPDATFGQAERPTPLVDLRRSRQGGQQVATTGSNARGRACWPRDCFHSTCVRRSPTGLAIIRRVFTRPRGFALTLAALAVLGVAGCSSKSASPKLTSREAAALRKGLASIRTAVAAHARGRARVALDRFSQLVVSDAAAGDIASRDLQALRAGIVQARQRIALDVSPAPSTPTTATAPAPTVATSMTTVTSTPAPPTPLTPAPKDKHPKGPGRDKGLQPSKEGHGHGKGEH